MNHAALRLNPRAILRQLFNTYSTDEYQALTGEEFTRIENAIKETGITSAMDRLQANWYRQLIMRLLDHI